MSSETYTPYVAPADAETLKLASCAHSRDLAANLVAVFRQLNSDIDCAYVAVGEPAVFAFLMTGQASLAMLEREMAPFESVPYRKLINSQPFAIKIGLCAPATPSVYVHRSNMLSHLTLQQLSQIFTNGNPQGDYSCWGQIDMASPLQETSIYPLRLPETAPLSVYLSQHHFDQRLASWAGEYVADTDALLGKLENMPAGIGIAESGRDSDRVRALPLSDGNGHITAATRDDMLSGAYPLTRYLQLYLPKDQNGKLSSHITQFAAFILSPAGQEIVSAHPRYAALSSELIKSQSQQMEHGS